MSVKETIILTAMYYDKTMSEELLAMFAADLADLPAAKVVEAYQTYRRDPKNRTFPLPAQIREIVSPTASPESIARDSAARIPEAIRLFGYNWPDKARKHIGEPGWVAVQRFGGWEHVCQHHGTSNMNALTFQAQARDIALAHVELAATGIDAKALPMPRNNQPGLQRMGDYMGLVPRPEESK